MALKGGEDMRKELKKLRAEYDLTQEQMAKICGVSRTAYGNIERGKSKGSMTFLLNVAKTFPEFNIDEIVKRGQGNAEQAENHSE